ncbi:MAG: thiamine phosphate synthase [Proteobacteria bacterium]|nr:thiamine phosphate synthase [Pseudomonadota bacterium]
MPKRESRLFSQVAPLHESHAAAPRRTGGLYAITDGPRDDLPEAALAALAGGAALLQYRDKGHDAARRLREARALAGLCARHGVPLIVNDDVQLVLASGAAGVHLGEDDADIAQARAALGRDAVIGVSCYDSLERAREATAAGADYLAFGAFFPSITKPGARHATPALLRDAREFGLPLVAIGGITPDNGGPLIDAGADYLAVISGVFGARDIRAATRRYAKLFDMDQIGSRRI